MNSLTHCEQIVSAAFSSLAEATVWPRGRSLLHQAPRSTSRRVLVVPIRVRLIDQPTLVAGAPPSAPGCGLCARAPWPRARNRLGEGCLERRTVQHAAHAHLFGHEDSEARPLVEVLEDHVRGIEAPEVVARGAKHLAQLRHATAAARAHAPAANLARHLDQDALRPPRRSAIALITAKPDRPSLEVAVLLVLLVLLVGVTALPLPAPLPAQQRAARLVRVRVRVTVTVRV